MVSSSWHFLCNSSHESPSDVYIQFVFAFARTQTFLDIFCVVNQIPVAHHSEFQTWLPGRHLNVKGLETIQNGDETSLVILKGMSFKYTLLC